MAQELDPCFKDINIENVNSCPNDETVAGLATKLYYIPEAHIATFTKPPKTNTTSYEGRITIPTTGLVPVTGKGWKKIDLLVEENELGNLTVGNKGNKKSKSELDVFIKGFKKQLVGFQNAHLNTPMIYGIPDSTGQMWIIGNKENPAFFDTSEIKTGKKPEDNSGLTGKISANATVLAYDGEMTLLPDTTTPPTTP